MKKGSIISAAEIVQKLIDIENNLLNKYRSNSLTTDEKSNFGIDYGENEFRVDFLSIKNIITKDKKITANDINNILAICLTQWSKLKKAHIYILQGEENKQVTYDNKVIYGPPKYTTISNKNGYIVNNAPDKSLKTKTNFNAGELITYEKINQSIEELYTIWNSQNQLDKSKTYCHSNCHSSCHGNHGNGHRDW